MGREATWRLCLLSVTCWVRMLGLVERVSWTSRDEVDEDFWNHWHSLPDSFVSSPTLWRVLFGLNTRSRNVGKLNGKLFREELSQREQLCVIGNEQSELSQAGRQRAQQGWDEHPSCDILPRAVTDACINSAVNCCGVSLVGQKFRVVQKEKPLVSIIWPKGQQWPCPFHYETPLSSLNIFSERCDLQLLTNNQKPKNAP